MIKVDKVSKRFDSIVAVDSVSMEIQEGSVFGMVGTNGAGKSTMLRMMAGVFCPDSGSITMDDRPIYENPEVKKDIFFVSDDMYFLKNGTPKDVAEFYATVYPHFDKTRFLSLTGDLGLEAQRKISTFSKGMKRQVALLCGICSGSKYLLCDEAFDGLDPVVRQLVKSLFAKEITERNLTPVLASHNLRELEDICDHVGLLHKGGVLLNKDLEELRCGIHKLQCVFQTEEFPEDLAQKLSILKNEKRGKLYTITVRGELGEIEAAVGEKKPLFFEMLPLTLEEIFISETEVTGYDFKKLIF